jgi:predicted RNA-binding protein YlqC (UPF0109 family)
MEDLVRHLVEPIASHPDEISLQVIEGEASLVFEMSVHPDDAKALKAEQGRTIRAIRTVLSAAAGRRKVTLDLVGADGDGSEE